MHEIVVMFIITNNCQNHYDLVEHYKFTKTKNCETLTTQKLMPDAITARPLSFKLKQITTQKNSHTFQDQCSFLCM